MIRKYPNLCKPITIGNVTFRNRMFSAPMSGAEITPECTIGPKSTAFYELRAKGGAAAIKRHGGGTRPDGLPVTPLTKAQIGDIVKAYYDTAKLAKLCGYEMIMIHGGHGWLINQFLSPYFNHRTDEYGGCFENRIRFAREVLSAVREAVGQGFPIEFRMSGSEFFEGGSVPAF